MVEEKLFGRSCPKCGELYKECQIAKISLGAGAQVNLMCEQGHKWSEFYTLTYQGYWWTDSRYDSYGKKVGNDIEE